MAVEFYEWTPLNAKTGTGTGDLIDLRGLNIKRLWFEFSFDSTGTVVILVGLNSATLNQSLGLTDCTTGTNDASIIQTDETVYVNTHQPIPPFIQPSISDNGSNITLKVYGESGG